MKVFRLGPAIGLLDKVLLPAQLRLRGDDIQARGPNLHLLPWRGSASSMDYNALKIQVLNLFRGSEELASDEVRRLLQDSKVDLSDKAVKMALMRYSRQGLLFRSKKKGLFHYRLTQKGISRRDWLAKAR